MSANPTPSLDATPTSTLQVTTSGVTEVSEPVATLDETIGRLTSYAPECILDSEPPPENSSGSTLRVPIADGKLDGLGLDSFSAPPVYGCQTGVMLFNVVFFDSTAKRDTAIGALQEQYGPQLRQAGQTLVVAIAAPLDGLWLAWLEKVDQVEPTPSFTLIGILQEYADLLGAAVYQLEF